MKITRRQLRKIIKEEFDALNENPAFLLGGAIGALLVGTPAFSWLGDIMADLQPADKDQISKASPWGLGEILDVSVDRYGTSEAKLFYTLDEITRRLKDLEDSQRVGFWRALYKGTRHGSRVWDVILADLSTDDVEYGAQAFVKWLRATDPPSGV